MNRKRHNSTLILGIFFIVLLLGGTVIFYFAGDKSNSGLPLANNLKGYFQTHRSDAYLSEGSFGSFNSLHQDFVQGGMERFHEKKNGLRQEVGKALESPDDTPERDRAQNIALYLFPDLLAKDDFERDVAMEQWVPQQKTIEEHPRSPESRRSFEELKNNVWNYENPDRQIPTISNYAESVIRIYDTLSRVE